MGAVGTVLFELVDVAIVEGVLDVEADADGTRLLDEEADETVGGAGGGGCPSETGR